tara:strand:+ start:237 stop:509 length:273 start_codon:yes stop_codon:yes gene_type:complete
MELKFFELLGHIQMKLTKSNVEASFEKMKDHLLEFDVTAEFVDIDYNYYGHTELMGPVVTFKTNKPDMDWFVQVEVEKDFPMLVGVIRVS